MARGRGSACVARAGEEGGGAGAAGGAGAEARQGGCHAAASGGEAVTASPPWPTVPVSNPATGSSSAAVSTSHVSKTSVATS